MPRSQKTRIIAHHQQVVRLDREGSAGADGAAARRLRDWVLAQLRRVDVVVVSDYGKGTDRPGAARRARRRARAAAVHRGSSIRSGPTSPHYRRVSLVKPNREEAAAASGIEIRDTASLRAAGTRLLERWDAEAVLISRGEHGMALFRRGRAVRDVPDRGARGLRRHRRRRHRGGDLRAGARRRRELEEAAVLANHAAGIVVGKIGTATVTAAELARRGARAT